MTTIRINTKSLVGLEELKALRLIEAAGGHMRVVMQDGIPQKKTTDLRLDRVNIELRGGKVVKAFVG